jgi:protein-arginine kinase activator protein McsA
VLFHRTQAAALAALEQAGPDVAVEEINRGLNQLQSVYRHVEAEEQFDADEQVAQLVQLKEWLRTEYHVGQTLEEQLAEAVATEQYERAAALRDQIARRNAY